MPCQKCNGTGMAKNKHYIALFPCPYCMGSGVESEDKK
jgi:DnaJ-class molecular chaperone